MDNIYAWRIDLWTSGCIPAMLAPCSDKGLDSSQNNCLLDAGLAAYHP